MRAAVFVIVLLVSGAATAQPAPARPWSPLDPDGWPVGETLSTLRLLPRCAAPLRADDPGGAIPCRPPAIVGDAHVAYAMDWTTGIAFGSPRTTGGVQAWGHELLFAVTRAVQLGVRYEMIGVSTPTVNTTPTPSIGNHVLGVLRYRHFVDEVDRSAWAFGGGLGQAFHGLALDGAAPIARVSLAREIGMYLDDDNAATLAFEIAYERALAALSTGGPLQLVTASAKVGFESDIREPANLGEPEPPPRGYLLRFGFLATAPGAPVPGLGFELGHAVARGGLGLETTVGYLFGLEEGATVHGHEGAQWSLMTGPRVGGALYVQAQAGAAWVVRPNGGEARAVGQAEIGAALRGCGLHGDAGFWLRGALDGGAITAAGVALRVAFPSRLAGRASGRCGAAEPPRYATEPLPPPPPEPPPREIYVERVEPVAPPAVEAQVAVEVKPIVVEVDLGVSLGGLVEVGIDPRVLPLDRLRGAGHITVELSGPSASLARFEARLRGTLDGQGLRVDGWSTIATEASRVRARFTIWPPGSRP